VVLCLGDEPIIGDLRGRHRATTRRRQYVQRSEMARCAKTTSYFSGHIFLQEGNW
jgi:hypothetical protein